MYRLSVDEVQAWKKQGLRYIWAAPGQKRGFSKGYG